MKFLSGIFCVLGIFLAVSCGRLLGPMSTQKEHWNPANDPTTLLPRSYVFNLQQLPLSGEIPLKPWADSYWPSSEGGLANRWAVGTPGHEVTPVTLEQAAGLSLAELAVLSPAEKFDIFAGDESLSLFNNEIERTHPTDESWFGICHGWAPVSLAWAEPKAVILTAASGLKVPFASSDIKGLLSLFSAEYAPRGSSRMLGSRCYQDLSANPGSATRPECRDVNAGAFHLVLANLLGLQHEGFVADVSRDEEVWNQPVSSFSSRQISAHEGSSPGAAPTTVREVTFETTMFYGREIQPRWESAGANMRQKVYKYRVELDRSGAVVGGEWLTKNRPDFLWSMPKLELLNSRPSYEPSYDRRAVAWTKALEIYNASMAAAVEAENPVHE